MDCIIYRMLKFNSILFGLFLFLNFTKIWLFQNISKNISINLCRLEA
jgi:hypothetical protein